MPQQDDPAAVRAESAAGSAPSSAQHLGPVLALSWQAQQYWKRKSACSIKLQNTLVQMPMASACMSLARAKVHSLARSTWHSSKVYQPATKPGSMPLQHRQHWR